MKELNCTQLHFLNIAVTLVKEGYIPVNSQVNNTANMSGAFVNSDHGSTLTPAAVKAVYDELLKAFFMMP